MHGRGVLGVGVLALAAGAALSPHAPALYDGLGFPDEPYRYAQVVADDPTRTLPPTTAAATLPLAAGSNADGAVLTTTETGPQLLAYIPKGALSSTVAGSIAISATPLAPDKPVPADGPVAGDIYRLSTGQPATWRPGANGTLSLRSPQGIPEQPTMEFRRPGQQSWAALATTRVGNDIWESPLGDLGDYALVLRRQGATTVGAPQSHTLVYLLTAVGVCAAAALVGARLALRKRDPVSDGPADGSGPS